MHKVENSALVHGTAHLFRKLQDNPRVGLWGDRGHAFLGQALSSRLFCLQFGGWERAACAGATLTHTVAKPLQEPSGVRQLKHNVAVPVGMEVAQREVTTNSYRGGVT